MGLNIQPIAGTNNRIIIEPAAAETKTASGIIIPDNAKEKPQKGTVVAVGNDLKDETSVLKIGEKVMYGKYAGTEFENEGKTYLIMKENEVFGIIKQ